MLLYLVTAFCFVAATAAAAEQVTIDGELRTWHDVTLSLRGPQASESDSAPNPFTDYGFWVDFVHAESGDRLRVPGYFAADGDAGESGATAGDVWRAHLAPHKAGRWAYRVRFTRGDQAALDPSGPGQSVPGVDGLEGSFSVEHTDKSGRDFRGKGRLCYVGQRYLRFAETDELFLKAGADSPETLLGYADFDGTTTTRTPLKTWSPHRRDWREGDPTWRGGKGKGLIGGLNYLAGKGLNSVSFITYNCGGDGRNVWPMTAPGETLHYDCSKLDQWGVVFDHAQRSGLYLHFKLQEQENDDNRVEGTRADDERPAPAALDGGELGVERKLYCKEMVARFGHSLALNWNLGEENTQSFEQQRAMAEYLRSIDPYNHHVVLHTFPPQQERKYRPHVGVKETLTGLSLQNRWDHTHRQTKKWVTESQAAGHPWVVANDEQGPADQGVPPDDAYVDRNQREPESTQDDIRKQVLWGNLMAGGAGVEYYFGYKLAEHDLSCEDWRSRDAAWDDCRHALEFFQDNDLPLVRMQSSDGLVSVESPSEGRGPTAYALAQPGEVYLVYLLRGGEATLDLTDAAGEYRVEWYDPRHGGDLRRGGVASVSGGDKRSIGSPPDDAASDWLAVVRRDDER